MRELMKIGEDISLLPREIETFPEDTIDDADELTDDAADEALASRPKITPAGKGQKPGKPEIAISKHGNAVLASLSVREGNVCKTWAVAMSPGEVADVQKRVEQWAAKTNQGVDAWQARGGQVMDAMGSDSPLPPTMKVNKTVRDPDYVLPPSFLQATGRNPELMPMSRKRPSVEPQNPELMPMSRKQPPTEPSNPELMPMSPDAENTAVKSISPRGIFPTDAKVLVSTSTSGWPVGRWVDRVTGEVKGIAHCLQLPDGRVVPTKIFHCPKTEATLGAIPFGPHRVTAEEISHVAGAHVREALIGKLYATAPKSLVSSAIGAYGVKTPRKIAPDVRTFPRANPSDRHPIYDVPKGTIFGMNGHLYRSKGLVSYQYKKKGERQWRTGQKMSYTRLAGTLVEPESPYQIAETRDLHQAKFVDDALHEEQMALFAKGSTKALDTYYEDGVYGMPRRGEIMQMSEFAPSQEAMLAERLLDTAPAEQDIPGVRSYSAGFATEEEVLRAEEMGYQPAVEIGWGIPGASYIKKAAGAVVSTVKKVPGVTSTVNLAKGFAGAPGALWRGTKTVVPQFTGSIWRGAKAVAPTAFRYGSMPFTLPTKAAMAAPGMMFRGVAAVNKMLRPADKQKEIAQIRAKSADQIARNAAWKRGSGVPSAADRSFGLATATKIMQRHGVSGLMGIGPTSMGLAIVPRRVALGYASQLGFDLYDLNPMSWFRSDEVNALYRAKKEAEKRKEKALAQKAISDSARKVWEETQAIEASLHKDVSSITKASSAAPGDVKSQLSMAQATAVGLDLYDLNPLSWFRSEQVNALYRAKQEAEKRKEKALAQKAISTQASRQWAEVNAIEASLAKDIAAITKASSAAPSDVKTQLEMAQATAVGLTVDPSFYIVGAWYAPWTWEWLVGRKKAIQADVDAIAPDTSTMPPLPYGTEQPIPTNPDGSPNFEAMSPEQQQAFMQSQQDPYGQQQQDPYGQQQYQPMTAPMEQGYPQEAMQPGYPPEYAQPGYPPEYDPSYQGYPQEYSQAGSIFNPFSWFGPVDFDESVKHVQKLGSAQERGDKKEVDEELKWMLSKDWQLDAFKRPAHNWRYEFLTFSHGKHPRKISVSFPDGKAQVYLPA